MLRFAPKHRPTLAAFITLLSFIALACQPKSVLDNQPSSAPSPTPAPAKTASSAAQPSVAVPTATTPLQPAPVSPTPAPSLVTGPLAVTQGQDFELLLLDSPKLKLSKLLGRRKVVVINFWATWCGPCRREIPELIALQNDYKNNKEVEIIGLSIEDPQQARELVQTFAKQFEINYKIGFSPVPMFLSFNTDPRAPIPQTFIFARDGKLVQHVAGLRPAFKDFIQQAVDLALKSS